MQKKPRSGRGFFASLRGASRFGVILGGLVLLIGSALALLDIGFELIGAERQDDLVGERADLLDLDEHEQAAKERSLEAEFLGLLLLDFDL